MKVIIFDVNNPMGEKVVEAKEDKSWYGHKVQLKKFSLIKAILFEKGFLWQLGEALKYSLIHYESYRGSNASDVLLFKTTKNFKKMWKIKDE